MMNRHIEKSGTPPRSGRRLGLFGILVLSLVIVTLGAVAVFSSLGLHRSVWLEEAYSVYVASQSPARVVEELKNDSDPPLYYLLLGVWLQLFGLAEPSIRSLSVLFYLLGILAVFGLGTAAGDRWAGLISAFLFAVSAVAVIEAQSTRMYTLLAMLGALSMLHYLRLFHRQRSFRGEWVLYAAVNTAGLFTHYWFIFVIAGQLAACLMPAARGRLRRFIGWNAFPIGLFLVLWLGILVEQLAYGTTEWMRHLQPGLAGGALKTLLGFFSGKQALFVYGGMLALLLVRVEGWKISLRRPREFKGYLGSEPIQVLLICFFFLLVVPLVVAQFHPVYRMNRSTILTLVLFVAIAGTALRRYANRYLVIVFCAVMLYSFSVGYVRHRTYFPRNSDRWATALVLHNAGEGDVIVFTSLSRATIEYYMRRIAPERTLLRFSFPAELGLHMGWQDSARMLENPLQLQRDADEIVRRLAGTVDAGDRIWVFYGDDLEISRVLKDRLDQAFSLRRKVETKGSFYSEVLIYRNLSDLAGTPPGEPDGEPAAAPPGEPMVGPDGEPDGTATGEPVNGPADGPTEEPSDDPANPPEAPAGS